MALPSTRNTPIEALWHQLQENLGFNMYELITQGRIDGIFNGDNEVHV
jgi:hypothetical protein